MACLFNVGISSLLLGMLTIGLPLLRLALVETVFTRAAFMYEVAVNNSLRGETRSWLNLTCGPVKMAFSEYQFVVIYLLLIYSWLAVTIMAILCSLRYALRIVYCEDPYILTLLYWPSRVTGSFCTYLAINAGTVALQQLLLLDLVFPEPFVLVLLSFTSGLLEFYCIRFVAFVISTLRAFNQDHQMCPDCLNNNTCPYLEPEAQVFVN